MTRLTFGASDALNNSLAEAWKVNTHSAVSLSSHQESGGGVDHPRDGGCRSDVPARERFNFPAAAGAAVYPEAGGAAFPLVGTSYALRSSRVAGNPFVPSRAFAAACREYYRQERGESGGPSSVGH